MAQYGEEKAQKKAEYEREPQDAAPVGFRKLRLSLGHVYRLLGRGKTTAYTASLGIHYYFLDTLFWALCPRLAVFHARARLKNNWTSFI
jgi:hypothetical protein